MPFPTLKQELDCDTPLEGHKDLLVITPYDEDETEVVQALRGTGWTVRRCHSLSDAAASIPENPPAVVICEQDLPDGTWRDILNLLKMLRPASPLIVSSRTADMDLWADVLHVGAYDLLAKPFQEREVRWAVTAASWYWESRTKDHAAA